MKIAIIAKTRLPIVEPFRGGLEAYTHGLCREYIRLGHEVTLYAHTGSDQNLNVKGFYGEEHRDDPYFELYEHDEYLSILKDIEEEPFDIVHNNATHELPILWGVKATIPMVTTLHTPPTSKLKAMVNICASSENLHFVLPSSSFEATWRPFLDKDSKLIPNGVDMEKWPLARTAKDYLFWFGRMVQAKGLDIVLDAAHELNMPLKFAGPIDDQKYFDEQISPRVREQDVYLGHLEQFELQPLMAGAAAMVSAVRWEEPFGLTNIEAMASGVPVAGFDRGAFREIINEHSGVLAKQRNVLALAKAIRDAIALDSVQVRQHAERFSLSRMARRYIDYFEELI